MDEANGSKPICIVLDTNIWVHKTSLLRTSLGAALTNSVVRLDAVLGLPEVVEEEIVKHTVRVGTEAAARIRQDLERVETLVGYRDRYTPPGEDQFEAGAKERLRELQDLLERVSYNFRQLRLALARVMDETAPNGPKNQQYKDSVIWEAVVELSGTYTVHFVTHDKGFFEDRDPRKGAASSLREECEAEGRDISVYHGLESYLESIRGEVPPLDYTALAQAVEREVRGDLLSLAYEQGFGLHELIDSRVSVFLTEMADTLALSFELEHRATILLPSGEEAEATVTTLGECSYNLRSRSASDVRTDRVAVTGAEGWGKGMVYLYGSVGIGGRHPIPYSLRTKLNEYQQGEQ